jgi:hypothetical protein
MSLSMKNLLLGFAFTLTFAAPGFANDRTYMGRAATGERVYYYGARTQCGNLPRKHECWRNPMVAYTVGFDRVTATTNCKKGVFPEVWVGGQVVARDVRPASEAMSLVLKKACNSVR